MFNSFLTFSAADGHWNELHRKLPGSEKYLGKMIVKSMEDVEESERDSCITELEDWFIKKAVDENQDILYAFFKKRVKTLWNEVAHFLG